MRTKPDTPSTTYLRRTDTTGRVHTNEDEDEKVEEELFKDEATSVRC